MVGPGRDEGREIGGCTPSWLCAAVATVHCACYRGFFPWLSRYYGNYGHDGVCNNYRHNAKRKSPTVRKRWTVATRWGLALGVANFPREHKHDRREREIRDIAMLTQVRFGDYAAK